MAGWHRPNGQARRPLPPGWKTIRLRVLARDNHKCQINDTMCTGHATEVDHIDTLGTDHSDHLLRAACTPCHAQRTKQQAAAGARAWHARGKRPVPPHPGLR